MMHGRLAGGAGGVACFIQEDDAFQPDSCLRMVG
jgi:hypothetical protein